MSSEDNLPSELASFESRLRGQPLPASVVVRDQLMYEAGWAAGEGSRKKNWLWPTTSGVLAASVLVLAGLLVSSSEELPVGGFSGGGAIVASFNGSDPPLAPPYEGGGFGTASAPRLRWTSRSPFLAMRARALRMEFDEPAAMTWADDEPTTKTITARELMQEILGETS